MAVEIERPAAGRGGSLKAAVQLLRPANFALFLAGVGVGGVLGAGPGAWSAPAGGRLLAAALSAALVGAAANALNDCFDLEIDRINRPERPLPAGRLSVRTARGVWLAGTALGLGLAAALSPAHLGLAAGAALLLYGYNRWLKRQPLTGNLVVAAVVALALVYGGMAVGNAGRTLVGAVFAFLTTLAREMIKDVEDREGDAASGARTLPVVAGSRTAVALFAATVGLAVLLTPLPFLAGRHGGGYLLLVLVADLLMLRAATLVLVDPPEPHAGRASRLLKAAMIAGLAALAVG